MLKSVIELGYLATVNWLVCVSRKQCEQKQSAENAVDVSLAKSAMTSLREVTAAVPLLRQTRLLQVSK